MCRWTVRCVGQMAEGAEPVGQGQTDETINVVGMSYRPTSSREEVDEVFFKLFEKVSVTEPMTPPRRTIWQDVRNQNFWRVLEGTTQ